MKWTQRYSFRTNRLVGTTTVVVKVDSQFQFEARDEREARLVADVILDLLRTNSKVWTYKIYDLIGE